jgi:prepilin-type N-terminal cleavage/methylation domain-containing protein
MSSTCGRQTKRRAGFSMIELLMVMVIISLTAAWALPKFSIARYRADAAGRLVRTQLSTAQRLAITRQSDVIVSFDATYNRLRVVQDFNNNDTLNTGDIISYRGLEEGAKFVTPTWAGPNGSTPATPFVGAGLRTISSLPSIIFHRDGSGSTDLEVYVTMRDAVKVEYRCVVVTGSTGKTDLFKWNGVTWIRMSQ